MKADNTVVWRDSIRRVGGEIYYPPESKGKAASENSERPERSEVDFQSVLISATIVCIRLISAALKQITEYVWDEEAPFSASSREETMPVSKPPAGSLIAAVCCYVGNA